MKFASRLFVFLFLTIALCSCSTDIKKYQNTNPRLDIKEYFSGKLIAWGMVQDYSAQVTRRFCVELEGTWQGNQGVLAETFYFNDGEISKRDWQLTKLTNGQYQGKADDVVGTAFGQQHGFAFQWNYQLVVPIDGQQYQFQLDDWMYQLDTYKVMNRTVMKKFGIAVAEITLFFDKQNPDAHCAKSAN